MPLFVFFFHLHVATDIIVITAEYYRLVKTRQSSTI